MSVILHKLEKMPTVQFIIVMAIIAYFIKIPFGILGSVVVYFFDITNPLYRATLQEPTFGYDDIVLAIAVAPALETLIAQFAPIVIVGKFTQKTQWKIIISALLFMLFHYPVLEFFPSAFAIGVIFAWIWVVKAKIRLSEAFWIVTLIHSLHNALVAATGAFLL